MQIINNVSSINIYIFQGLPRNQDYGGLAPGENKSQEAQHVDWYILSQQRESGVQGFCYIYADAKISRTYGYFT